MTDEEINLEYEMYLVAEGKAMKTCPRCGLQTHRSTCPVCETDGTPLPLTGDSEMDAMISEMEQGKKIDLNELFKSGNFEPVPRGN